MAASFPASKKTFSQVVNGVTKLVALLFNSNYDETEAIETLLGAMGRAQSYSESYKNMLSGLKIGCKLSYKDANEITIAAGKLAIPDASGNLAFRKNAASTDVGWANIDTGAEANGQLYYVYAVADDNATTISFVISTSANAPSGYTYYLQIGSFYNDSGGDIDRDTCTSLPHTSEFGVFFTRSKDTNYEALTDGFVIVYPTTSDSGQSVVSVLADSSSPPTTVRGAVQLDDNDFPDRGSITIPVKKGWYYKITDSGTITLNIKWVPVIN